MTKIAAAGRESIRLKLEQLVRDAKACRAMRAPELHRLAASDSAVAVTYFQQTEGGAQPDPDAAFDHTRRAAESLLFGFQAKNIHYAALSPDGRWLQSYGDGAVFFREEMIAHRATLFEENVVLWMTSSGSMPASVPKGHRARWADREKLGVAKLAPILPDDEALIAPLLLHVGATTKEDRFLEVHVFGPYTLRSVERVVVKPKHVDRLARRLIAAKAKKFGFVVEEAG